MPSPAGPYKVAQEAALRGSAALETAMVGRLVIYTEVPTNAPLPYVVLGNDQVLQEPGCATEAEVISTIGFWSRTDPRDKGVQARAMGSAMIDALNVQLVVDGWDVDEWEVREERYSTDPDQSTHGVLVIRHLLTSQAA
jgi:hypothetical protein